MPTNPDSETYGLLYDEALRSLQAQAANLDELRSRSGALLAAFSIAGGLLGGGVLIAKPGASLLAFVGIVLLAISAVCAVVVLLPLGRWEFQTDAKVLLGSYVEGSPPADLSEFRRSLAWYFAEAEGRNRVKLVRLYRVFALAGLTAIVGMAILLAGLVVGV